MTYLKTIKPQTRLAIFICTLIACAISPLAFGAEEDLASTKTLPLGRGSGTVLIADIDNRVIGPITAEYVDAVVDKAEKMNVECLIIKLDTPGGMLESTKRIVGKILNAKVPICVYVQPSGARAASAGVFITMAGHIAAMAPGTHIGAAHPVNLAGRDPGEGEDEEIDKKEDNELIRELSRLIRDEKEKEGKEEEKKADFRPIDDEKGLKPIEEKPEEDNEKINAPKVADEEADDGAPKASARPMDDKIMNDTIAWSRNIAEMRGRNAKWAELAIRASVSITEQEAVDLNVVNFVAKNERDLLEKLQDFPVLLSNDENFRLDTINANIERMPMSLRYRLLDVVVHPEIALILLSLGFLGILYEITHPGIGVPGIVGTIFFIVGLYAMHVLPVSYAALLLIALSIVLFIAEAKVASWGLLTLGGLVCMVLGSLMLIRDPAPFTGGISLKTVLPVAFTTAAITVGLVTLVIRTRRGRVQTGADGMIGERGIAITDIDPEGRVEIRSESWRALSEGEVKITKGQRVVVTKVDGLTCTVKFPESD